MTLKDILKRKPEKASGEFWGGKKTAWEKGQKVEVETEGWFEEMCLKTVKREVYSAKNMPRDPKKIDDAMSTCVCGDQTGADGNPGSDRRRSKPGL